MSNISNILNKGFRVMDKLSEENITVDGVPCLGSFEKKEVNWSREEGGYVKIVTVPLRIAFDQLDIEPGIEARVVRIEEDNNKYVVRGINSVAETKRWEIILLQSNG